MEQATEDKDLLVPLQNFVRAVWGNDTIFKGQKSYYLKGQERTVSYFDFGEHIRALKILHPTFSTSKFLVRKEYLLAMEAFDVGYETGSVIIGQPGIGTFQAVFTTSTVRIFTMYMYMSLGILAMAGKTYFLIYALIERLLQGKPVAFQLDRHRYALFAEAEVTLHDAARSRTPLWRSDLWALSDSNEITILPADAFQSTADIRIFQATSPAFKRWKGWSKQRNVGRFVMDVWSIEETADLACVTANFECCGDLISDNLSSLLDLDVERMIMFATSWGGVPRTLLQLFRPPRLC